MYGTAKEINLLADDQLVGVGCSFRRIRLAVDLNKLEFAATELVARLGKAELHRIGNVVAKRGISAGVWKQQADLDLGPLTERRKRRDDVRRRCHAHSHRLPENIPA